MVSVHDNLIVQEETTVRQVNVTSFYTHLNSTLHYLDEKEQLMPSNHR